MRYSDYSYGGRLQTSSWGKEHGDYSNDDWNLYGTRDYEWCNWHQDSWYLSWNSWGWSQRKNWWRPTAKKPDAIDDDLRVVAPNDQITGNLLDNDLGQLGNPLIVTHINGVKFYVGFCMQFSNGMIKVGTDGSFLIEADEDFSFTYTISNGRYSDTATVEVSVIDPLFFLAPRGGEAAIWKTDGTAEGTVEVLNLNAAGVRFATQMRAFKDGVLFRGFDDDAGSEPWFSDGTVGGTFRLADLNDSGSSSPFGFTEVGDKAVFQARVDGIGTELFVTDGTPEGTGLLADIREGPGTSNPIQFLAIDDLVYFQAGTDEEGRELWRTDGTPGGTFLVQDIRPGPDSSNANPQFELDGKVIFTANLDNNGVELWISDGTQDGATLLADDTRGAGLGPDGDTYFFRRDDQGTYDLWRSDGTVDGTGLVADINTNGRGGSFAQLGDSFVFAANLRESGGFELWETDGTSVGTALVTSINSTGGDVGVTGAYDPQFTPVGDGLIFRVDDGINGFEPWFTDGTAAGTFLIEDINHSGDSINKRTDDPFIPLSNLVVFKADSTDEGTEPWVSDGTPEGTFLLADIIDGPGSSHPDDFIFW